MNNISIFVFITMFIISYLVARRMMSKSQNRKLKKRFQEFASLNSYIEDLGFKPTAIYATIGWIKKSCVDESVWSQVTQEAVSHATTLSEKYKEKERGVKTLGAAAFWFPLLGIFLNADKKVFAVRSNAEETTPKVYKFSQLQSFAVSEDTKSDKKSGDISAGGVVGASGNVTMRINLSGTSGLETIDLKPELFSVWGTKRQVNINRDSPLYKIKYEELTMISYCLQWIMNNA